MGGEIICDKTETNLVDLIEKLRNKDSLSNRAVLMVKFSVFFKFILKLVVKL